LSDRNKVLPHFSFPLSVLLNQLESELNPYLFCVVFPALDLHSNGPHFSIVVNCHQRIPILSVCNIDFVIGWMADGSNTIPIPKCGIVQVLLRLFVGFMFTVPERRCFDIKLVQVVQDFYEVSEAFDWCLQFQKGIVVDLPLIFTLLLFLLRFRLVLFYCD